MEICPTEALFLDGSRLNLPAWSWGGGVGAHWGMNSTMKVWYKRSLNSPGSRHSTGWVLPACSRLLNMDTLTPSLNGFHTHQLLFYYYLWKQESGGMFGKTRSSTSLENMAQELYFCLFLILTMWHKLRRNKPCIFYKPCLRLPVMQQSQLVRSVHPNAAQCYFRNILPGIKAWLTCQLHWDGDCHAHFWMILPPYQNISFFVGDWLSPLLS